MPGLAGERENANQLGSKVPRRQNVNLNGKAV
jgi:hypothetical protein